MREEAAELFKIIIDKFGDTETQICSQIAEEILRTIFQNKIDAFSMYGAILVFSYLGRQIIQLYLLPKMNETVKLIINSDNFIGHEKLVYKALLDVVGTALFCDQYLMCRNGHYTYDACTMEYMPILSHIFGCDLRPFMYEESDALLFI